jgi:DnaJ-class molecular chaperone
MKLKLLSFAAMIVREGMAKTCTACTGMGNMREETIPCPYCGGTGIQNTLIFLHEHQKILNYSKKL